MPPRPVYDTESRGGRSERGNCHKSCASHSKQWLEGDINSPLHEGYTKGTTSLRNRDPGLRARRSRLLALLLSVPASFHGDGETVLRRTRAYLS